LDTALAIALQIEVWANTTQTRQTEPKAPAELKRTQKIKEQKFIRISSAGRKKKVTKAKKTADENRKVAEESRKAELEAKKQMEKTKRKLAKLETRLVASAPGDAADIGAGQSTVASAAEIWIISQEIVLRMAVEVHRSPFQT